jgi:hypothetical protein
MKLRAACLFSGLLLTGCMHRPLTPGQKLLLTAPTSSRPVLHERCYYDPHVPAGQQHEQNPYCFNQANGGK